MLNVKKLMQKTKKEIHNLHIEELERFVIVHQKKEQIARQCEKLEKSL